MVMTCPEPLLAGNSAASGSLVMNRTIPLMMRKTVHCTKNTENWPIKRGKSFLVADLVSISTTIWML